MCKVSEYFLHAWNRQKGDMSDLKYSILPHVLKEYNPDYEPKSS